MQSCLFLLSVFCKAACTPQRGILRVHGDESLYNCSDSSALATKYQEFHLKNNVYFILSDFYFFMFLTRVCVGKVSCMYKHFMVVLFTLLITFSRVELLLLGSANNRKWIYLISPCTIKVEFHSRKTGTRQKIESARRLVVELQILLFNFAKNSQIQRKFPPFLRGRYRCHYSIFESVKMFYVRSNGFVSRL